MNQQPTITLECVRKDGRRETTTITDHPLSDARELAKRVLDLGNGLYKEVDIRTDDGYVEKVQNYAGVDTIWMT